MEDEGGPPPPEDSRAADAPLTVGDIMTTHVSAAWEDSTVKELALIMADEAIGGVPVVGPDNRLIGLVTYRDIVLRACAGDKRLEDLHAGDAMTTEPTGIGPGESLSRALETMATLQVHRLPVLDDSAHLIGMISLGDIAAHGDDSATAAELRDTLARISDRQSSWNGVWR